MSAAEQTNSLREFLESLLEVASAKLAELNEPVGPETLTRVVIEFMSSPTFWTETMKTGLYEAILPTVQAWFDERR